MGQDVKNEWDALPTVPRGQSYRVGVTSYVYPADISANMDMLAGRVDDVQLVLFESDDVCNFPSAETIERLAETGRRSHLTYTIHFPIDRKLGSPSVEERMALTAQIRALVRLTAPLSPHAYILHLEGIEGNASAAERRRWEKDTTEAVGRILEDGPEPARFCIENLGYPFEWCDTILETFGLAVCIDVGHLWCYHAPVAAHLEKYLPRTRVIHLHGERDGRDHLPLTETDPERLASFLRAIRDYSGVVTLEVFEYSAARNSIERLTRWLENAKGM